MARNDTVMVLKMNDGSRMPAVGLGTFAPNGSVQKCDCVKAIKYAIEIGYRHFDGAFFYGNENEVGEAIREKIKDGTVKREDIFYTGKALESCKDAGLVKSIGVSNFNARQLGKILNKPGLKYKPVCNQVECHPYLKQEKLLEFCKSSDIVLVAYCPIGSSRHPNWTDQSTPVVLMDPQLSSIAEKYSRTVAQIALRYLLQRGIAVIPKSFNFGRIKENFQVFDFTLAEEDMNLINNIPIKTRYINMFTNYPDCPFLDEY